MIVHKCFAGRENDWSDARGVLARHWGPLNLELIRQELQPLSELKGQTESMARLDVLIDKQQKTANTC